MTRRSPPTSTDEPTPRLSAPKRALVVVVALAYLVLATWFFWGFFGEDSIPEVLGVGSIVAAVIVIADVGWRLFTQRRDRSR